MNIRLFIAIHFFRFIARHILPLQQKFLSGVSAAFLIVVSQQSKTEHGSGHEMNIAFYIIVKCKKAIFNAI